MNTIQVLFLGVLFYFCSCDAEINIDEDFWIYISRIENEETK